MAASDEDLQLDPAARVEESYLLDLERKYRERCSELDFLQTSFVRSADRIKDLCAQLGETYKLINQVQATRALDCMEKSNKVSRRSAGGSSEQSSSNQMETNILSQQNEFIRRELSLRAIDSILIENGLLHIQLSKAKRENETLISQLSNLHKYGEPAARVDRSYLLDLERKYRDRCIEVEAILTSRHMLSKQTVQLCGVLDKICRLDNHRQANMALDPMAKADKEKVLTGISRRSAGGSSEQSSSNQMETLETKLRTQQREFVRQHLKLSEDKNLMKMHSIIIENGMLQKKLYDARKQKESLVSQITNLKELLEINMLYSVPGECNSSNIDVTGPLTTTTGRTSLSSSRDDGSDDDSDDDRDNDSNRDMENSMEILDILDVKNRLTNIEQLFLSDRVRGLSLGKESGVGSGEPPVEHATGLQNEEEGQALCGRSRCSSGSSGTLPPKAR